MYIHIVHIEPLKMESVGVTTTDYITPGLGQALTVRCAIAGRDIQQVLHLPVYLSPLGLWNNSCHCPVPLPCSGVRTQASFASPSSSLLVSWLLVLRLAKARGELLLLTGLGLGRSTKRTKRRRKQGAPLRLLHPQTRFPHADFCCSHVRGSCNEQEKEVSSKGNE